MAKYDYAMFLKQRGQIAEPIVMKGGIVVSAYKKKGPVADPSNHRALMVSSTIAKHATAPYETTSTPTLMKLRAHSR